MEYDLDFTITDWQDVHRELNAEWIISIIRYLEREKHVLTITYFYLKLVMIIAEMQIKANYIQKIFKAEKNLSENKHILSQS